MFSLDAKNVQQICQSALHDFNLCMFRQESEQHPLASSISSDDKPNRLSNEMVFKIIIICLAMIHVMQKDGQFYSCYGQLQLQTCMKLVYDCWRHSIVVRMLVSTGKLSLSCARLLAGWVTTLWLNRPLSVSQHGQLSHPSVTGR